MQTDLKGEDKQTRTTFSKSTPTNSLQDRLEATKSSDLATKWPLRNGAGEQHMGYDGRDSKHNREIFIAFLKAEFETASGLSEGDHFHYGPTHFMM